MIKSIRYENNGQLFTINIGEKNQLEYENILSVVTEEQTFEYLRNLFGIIDNWDTQYINTKMIDNSSWKLSIIYSNGNKNEYRGKSNYPNNFEAFERLNQRLIEEVQNG